MSKKSKISIVVVVLILAITGGHFVFSRTNESSNVITMSTQNTAQNLTESDEDKTTSSTKNDAQIEGMTKGRYTAYSSENTASAGYNKNIIFFYAPWCPECRAFKEAIQAETIPDGTQILETDFDSSTDLKKKYGITLQSTFVRVNNNGEMKSKWVGYGKDKSLNTVLENLE